MTIEARENMCGENILGNTDGYGGTDGGDRKRDRRGEEGER
jgi:hypothetical protein